jgi:phosphoserine aminotransferase
LNIPDNYDVVWIQGGGRMQFAMLPMNFLTKDTTALYAESGHWAQEAMRYAQFYGNVISAGSTENIHFSQLPVINIPTNTPLSYLHITSNNTIYGTQYVNYPETHIPLVADMSSDIFSKPIDVTAFKMIYAVAQKNIGMAGVTMVIIDKAFANSSQAAIPEILSYKAYIQHHSLINTAPMAAIYSCLLNLRWIAKRGLENIHKDNTAKANLLYQYLEHTGLFHLYATQDRSIMNVCFSFKETHHNATFIHFAAQQGIVGIAGHRQLGGLRISLYNSITLQDVQQFISVMKKYLSQ